MLVKSNEQRHKDKEARDAQKASRLPDKGKRTASMSSVYLNSGSVVQDPCNKQQGD